MVRARKGTPCSPTPAWFPGSGPWTATLLLPRPFSRLSLFLLRSLEISACPSGHVCYIWKIWRAVPKGGN